MAKYTTELRSICEFYAGYDHEQSYSNVDKVISKALPKLFDFDWPIFDENYRTVLETKFVRHYYTREIGAETVGRWKLFLYDKLNMIMPYYNQLYKSELIVFNPLYDIDLTTKHDKGNSGNTSSTSKNTGSSSSDSEGWTYNNDTPQGGVNGLETLNYLTSASKDTDKRNANSTSNGEGTGKYTDTETYLEHVSGKTASKSYSELLNEYRKTFLNIDQRVINDLADLFMNLW